MSQQKYRRYHNKNHLLITLLNSQVLDIYSDISSFNREVAKNLEQVKQRLIEEGILIKSMFVEF